MNNDLIAVYAASDESPHLLSYLSEHLPDAQLLSRSLLFGDPPMDVSVQPPLTVGAEGPRGTTVILVKSRLGVAPAAQRKASNLVFDAVCAATSARVELIAEDDTVVRERPVLDRRTA